MATVRRSPSLSQITEDGMAVLASMVANATVP